ERLDRDERCHDGHPAAVVRLEEADVRRPEEHTRRHEAEPAAADSLPRPAHDQQSSPEQCGGRGHRGRDGRRPDREVAHEVVADREERCAGEGVGEADPVEVRRALALPSELHPTGHDQDRPQDQRRTGRLAEKDERDRHRHERRRSEDHRDARSACVSDCDRDEDLSRAGREQAHEDERPGGRKVEATVRRLGHCGDKRHDKCSSGVGDRPESNVGTAVERHPQRHAHRAEEDRREEREPDGGYTASSAPSGVGLPCEKSGMNTCASGPIDSAYTSVPMPTVPPRSQPVTSTVTSMLVRTTRIEWPRAASPVIRPSRGPGPRPAPMYAPVATPFRKTPMTRHATRATIACGAWKCPRTTFIVRPTRTTLLAVPSPGRWWSGIQSSSTTTPTMIAQVPIARPNVLESPWWKTSHGSRPRFARTSRDELTP